MVLGSFDRLIGCWSAFKLYIKWTYVRTAFKDHYGFQTLLQMDLRTTAEWPNGHVENRNSRHHRFLCMRCTRGNYCPPQAWLLQSCGPLARGIQRTQLQKVAALGCISARETSTFKSLYLASISLVQMGAVGIKLRRFVETVTTLTTLTALYSHNSPQELTFWYVWRDTHWYSAWGGSFQSRAVVLYFARPPILQFFDFAADRIYIFNF